MNMHLTPENKTPDSLKVSWGTIEALFDEMITLQQKTLLTLSRQIIPHLTEDDLLQPNDFLELELHAPFRYEEGLLSGLYTAQAALKALKKDQEATAHKLEVNTFGASSRACAICEESIAPALLTTNKARQAAGRSPNELLPSL